jgi:hypothetical protein
MGSRALGASLVLGLLAAGPAHAERPVPPAAAMTSAPRPGIGDDLAARLARLGEAIDAELGALSLDAVQFRIDGRARRAYLGVHRDGPRVGFRIESSIGVRRDAAAIDTRLEAAIGGRHLALVVPIELVPRSYLGERYLEVSVPIIRQPF